VNRIPQHALPSARFAAGFVLKTAAGLGLFLAAQAQTPPPATPQPKQPVPGQLAAGVEVTDPNKVVMTVGTEKITAAQYDQLVNALPAQYQKAARGPQKRQIAEQMVQLKVLSTEAEKRGVDKDPLVKQQLAFDRENVLAGALYNELVKSVKIDDAALQSYYAAHKADFETVKARHILIRFKGSAVPLRTGQKELSDEEALAKAQDVRKQLVAGGDFMALAKSDSDDTGSGANGGDLGSFKHGQMVGAFETAAFSLPVGQISEPVKTQFGYHIIKVEEKQSKTLDDAKGEIADKLRPEAAKKEVDDMRKKAAVTFDEGYFGPAAPAAPPMVKPGPGGNQ
jgi:peptidyl-prolyl cis-trans isomerase C